MQFERGVKVAVLLTEWQSFMSEFGNSFGGRGQYGAMDSIRSNLGFRAPDAEVHINNPWDVWGLAGIRFDPKNNRQLWVTINHFNELYGLLLNGQYTREKWFQIIRARNQAWVARRQRKLKNKNSSNGKSKGGSANQVLAEIDIIKNFSKTKYGVDALLGLKKLINMKQHDFFQPRQVMAEGKNGNQYRGSQVVASLKQKNILLETGTKGHYKINPKFVTSLVCSIMDVCRFIVIFVTC